ncbi:uncharacterized protein LOC117560033 [Gymnodraco acuticeps]|uniref:Uncharacterized protein LOC117560033 n=1 Tax=Gymnodraco acuticeps TaxID=8218 RepID=A0A6P8W4B3_GYMAC|nr:uncharacterized protein LOC117560033 [Gymnodraco acuticeps]
MYLVALRSLEALTVVVKNKNSSSFIATEKTPPIFIRIYYTEQPPQEKPEKVSVSRCPSPGVRLQVSVSRCLQVSVSRRLQASPGVRLQVSVSRCPSPGVRLQVSVSRCLQVSVSRRLQVSPGVRVQASPGVSRWDSMSSKGGGTALTRRNYRLASDTDKPRSTGIVNEKLLSDYLHHVFPPSTNQAPALASLRKPLGFQDLGAHLEKLLSEGEPAEDSRGEGHCFTPLLGEKTSYSVVGSEPGDVETPLS